MREIRLLPVECRWRIEFLASIFLRNALKLTMLALPFCQPECECNGRWAIRGPQMRICEYENVGSLVEFVGLITAGR